MQKLEINSIARSLAFSYARDNSYTYLLFPRSLFSTTYRDRSSLDILSQIAAFCLEANISKTHCNRLECTG